jgi:RNA polymerase sigma-70 factor (ECF subfamily)
MMAAMSSNPGAETSLTLIERVQKFPADAGAWDEFVRRYHPMIRTWCVKWGLQVPDADDVAQDVLVKLLTAMRKLRYDPSRSFSGWLRTVTHNTLNDFCNNRRKGPGQVALEIAIADQAARDDFVHGLEGVIDRDLFETALRRIENRVKPGTWNAFRLTALEGLSGQDAGERLNMPVAHVFVARNRVQKLLQAEIRYMKGLEA